MSSGHRLLTNLEQFKSYSTVRDFRFRYRVLVSKRLYDAVGEVHRYYWPEIRDNNDDDPTDVGWPSSQPDQLHFYQVPPAERDKFKLQHLLDEVEDSYLFELDNQVHLHRDDINFTGVTTDGDIRPLSKTDLDTILAKYSSNNSVTASDKTDSAAVDSSLTDITQLVANFRAGVDGPIVTETKFVNSPKPEKTGKFVFAVDGTFISCSFGGHQAVVANGDLSSTN